MTEEHGGEQVGRLWVDIGGDAKTLDDVLATVETRLKEFIKTEYQAKVGVSFEETGGAQSRPQGLIDRHGKTLGKAIGQSALGQLESTPVKIKDVRVEATPKVDKQVIIDGVQAALTGHAFKLTIDSGHIREQIQAALGNLSIGVGHVAAAAAPPQPRGITPEQRAEFDARFRANKFSAIGGSRQDLGSVVENLARDVHSIIGGNAQPGGPTAALEDLIDTLGDDINKWGESFAKLAPDEDITAARVENIAKKFSKGPLGQEIVAARQAVPKQDVNANATFVAQAANIIAKAVHEQAPAPEPVPDEAVRRRRATLSDATFVGKPFSSDLVAQFVGKYFTPELSRIGGSKNQPDFGALGNLAEYSEKEKGTGRPSPTGRYIGFDAESKSPVVARLKANKPVRYPEGEVRRKSIGEVLTAAVSRLRGQPEDQFPDDIQARLAKIIEVAETANRNTATVKPGKGNRSGILSLSPSLQSYASQDVRLSEINRIIERIQKGGGGAFAARRLVGLQSERDRLVEGGAQSIRYPSRFDRNIARASERAASRRSRQAVGAGIGKTRGELDLEDRQRNEEDAARNLASPYTSLIQRIPKELRSGGNTENLPTQRYVSERFRAIRGEAESNFGGKLPRGVGNVLAEELKAVRNFLDPRNGGTAVPSGGGKSTFTRGRSFADEDDQAAERGTPTGIVRPPLPTARSLRIGELEANLGQSASEIARSQGGPRAGVDPQTQQFVRRSRQRAERAAKDVGINLFGPSGDIGAAGTKTLERIQASQENDPIRPKKGKAGDKDRQLLAARTAFRATVPAANDDDQELRHLRTVRDKARSFVERNQSLGLTGVLDKAGGKHGAVRNVSREVEDEIRDMLRIPSAGTGGKRSRSLEERGESGEPNSIARALGKDFIGERNPVKSGDELRAIHSKIAFTANGPTAPTRKETTAWLAGEGSLLDLADKKNPGSSGGGSGVTGGGGSSGSQFGGFPVPLPVQIVASIPLTIMGGDGVPRTARDGGRVASAADKAESVGLAGGVDKLRYPRTGIKRRKNLTPRDVGTAVDPNRVYTYEPEDETEEPRAARAREIAANRRERPQSPAERDFLATLRNVNKPGPTDEQQEIKALARQRRLRTRARQSDPLAFAAFQDVEEQGLPGEEDKSLGAVRARLREVNRRIPRRSFGASLTDLLSTAVPGSGSLKEQLRFGDLAAREAAEIEKTSDQRSATRTTLAGLPPRIAEAKAKGDTEGLKNLLEVEAQQKKALENQNKVIEISTKRFNQFSDEATKTSRVIKAFGASAIGGAAAGGLGALQFAAGSVIAQPLIAAASEAFSRIGNELDRLSGFSGTTSRITGALADSTLGAGGRADVAFNQDAATRGLSAATAARFEPILTERATTEAGNKQLQTKIEELNATIKVREENLNRIGDKNLTESTGGILGIGATAPTSELISTEFDLLPTAEQRGQQSELLSDAADALEIPDASPEAKRKAADVADGVLKQLVKSQDVIKFFNDALVQGGEATLKFSDQTDKTSEADRNKQEIALRSVGAAGLADKVRDQRVVLTENGQAVTDRNRIVAGLQAINNPKQDPEQLLKTLAPSIKAQQYLTRRQQQFSLEQAPIQEGIANSQQPFLPATAGFTAKDAAGFKTELGGAQKIFDQLAKEAKQARTDAVAFFSEAFQGDTQGAQQFSDSLEKSAQYGQQISKIELGVQTAQAALAAKQYSFQISQVKRSLADALGLQGKITSGAQNLGVIERQQFELQRQAQALSLGQSQRQINFQRAIAGLTAPGLTGEERAARIQQAKIEADYAQKQLDIQKKLFGLGGKQFQITADRNVIDLTRNLELLSAGREVTLKTAVAQKQIQALTALQAGENKRIQTFYQSAVDATGQVMQLEATLVAQTEVGLNKVGNLVLTQFRKVYTGLITELTAGTSSQQNPAKPKSGQAFATGGLFNTQGATDITVGEAGNETVAVLKNPRSVTGSFGGGGGSTQIVIDLRGANVTGDEQMKRLTQNVQEAVERGLAKKGNLLGLR